MKNIPATTLALILASALLATAETSTTSQPVPPESLIKEVISDSEELPEEIPHWSREATGVTCIVENGVGYKESKGMHIMANIAGHIIPDPKTWFNAPMVDLGDSDGIMFWIGTQKALGISLFAADTNNQNVKYTLGDGVMVMDENGEMVETSKPANGLLTLPPAFEGWVLIPNTISQDGTSSGWKGEDVATLERLTAFYFWTPGGDFTIDHLSLYKKK
jgi:hypothetical protein